MENNSITGSNLNTKHSLLSAQADLNTGTVFHNDAIPPRPASVPPAQPLASKPLPQSVQDTAEEFRKRMEAEKEKSISALQSTVDTIAPDLSKHTPPNMTSTPLEHAESTRPLNNPFVGMATQKPTQVQHSVSMGNDVVFDSETVDTQPVKGSGRSHSVILIISILVILGLLGGGVFYWYTYMGGKDLVQQQFGSNEAVTEGMEKTPETVKPTQTFPAVVRTATSTPTVPVKPNSGVNTNTFAPAQTTTITPKKTATFGDAEKEIVSTYISTNINKLSRVKSSSGFSVEDIRFDGPNRALVSYGDGDISVSAVLNFTYTNGTVKVNSFSILEK